MAQPGFEFGFVEDFFQGLGRASGEAAAFAALAVADLVDTGGEPFPRGLDGVEAAVSGQIEHRVAEEIPAQAQTALDWRQNREQMEAIAVLARGMGSELDLRGICPLRVEQPAGEFAEFFRIRRAADSGFDPFAQRVALAGMAQPRQFVEPEFAGAGGAARQIQPGEIIQQRFGLDDQLARVFPVAAIARPAPLDQRQDLVAAEVAVEAGVAVGIVIDPPQPAGLGVVSQLPPGNAEQGPDQRSFAQLSPLWDSAQTPGPRPPQQPQQDGFHLVVEMMGEQQAFARLQFAGESPVAGGSGMVLKIAAGCRHIHPQHLDGNPVARAKVAAKRLPAPGFGMEAMIDMQRAQAPGTFQGPCRQIKQDGRIHATAETHRHAALGGQFSEDLFRRQHLSNLSVCQPVLGRNVRRL